MNSNCRKPIIIDEKSYVISSELVDEIWKILLTNINELFIEKLSRQNIVERCEILNPLLSIEDVELDNIIHELFDNIPKYATEISIDKIKLQTVIDGGVFKFIINLSRANNEEFEEQIMQPVICYVAELQKKFNDLISEVKRKDEEIFEYKANGAKLLREHIETKPFDVSAWIPDKFKQYEEILSMCHSSFNDRTKFDLEKNIDYDKNKKRKITNSNS